MVENLINENVSNKNKIVLVLLVMFQIFFGKLYKLVLKFLFICVVCILFEFQMALLVHSM